MPHPYYFSKFPLIVWQALPYEWIADRDVENGARVNILMVRMARNEREHAAFAMTNNTAEPMTVAVTAECDGIPSDAIEVRRVVMLEGEQMGGSIVFNDFNEMWLKPELLETVKGELQLAPKSTVHLWITINSRNVSSGLHRGWVTLTIQGSADQPTRIPLKVEVWPFSLPEKTGLQILTYTSLSGPPELAEKIAKLQADRNVNMAYFEIPLTDEGRIDGSRYDWLQRLKIAKKWDFVPVFEAVDYSLDQIKKLGPLETVMHDLGFKNWLVAMSAEPLWEQVPGVVERSKALREVCPSAMTFHAVWNGFFNNEEWDMSALEALDGNIGMYNMFHNYTMMDIFNLNRFRTWPRKVVDYLADEQKQGRWVTFYHNNYRSVSYRNASLAWFRPDGWYCWKYGFDGYRTWCGRSLPHYDAADHAGVKNQQMPLEKQPLGLFVYVHKIEGGEFEVVSCKRLEAWADGVRDSMYLQILDDLIHQADASGDPKLKAMAEDAKATIDDCIEEVRMNNANSYAYSSAKRRLALEIIKFNKAGLQPKLNADGSVVRHRLVIQDNGYLLEDGGIERIEQQGAL